MQLKFVTFLVMLICAIACATAERPAKCLEPRPKGEGMCLMAMMGFYYNPENNKCEEWNDGGCRLTAGNSYNTLEQCQAECE